MNEPQIWTLIGVFAASMVGVIAILQRTMNVQFSSLRNELKSELDALRHEVKGEIGSLRAEIAHLDRDVQAISKRVFPE